MGAYVIGGSAYVIGGSAYVIGPRGGEGKMNLQFNINDVGGSLTGWNAVQTDRTVGIKIPSGSVVDDAGDVVTGVSLELLQGGDGAFTTGPSTGWPELINTGPNAGQSANDTDWPNPEITQGNWFATTIDLEFAVNGLTPGIYDVEVYVGVRDDLLTRESDITITGTGTVLGSKMSSPLSAFTGDRLLAGQITIDGTGIGKVLIEQAIGSTSGTISGFTIREVLGPPVIDVPYADLINLDSDVVQVDLNTNISGEATLTITWDPEIPNGLTETAGVVSGTVTTPTGTAISTVVGSNSFGKVTDTFQWTTLTTGDPTSGILVPIIEP